MTHDQKVKALTIIRPDAAYILHGEDLQWQDETQTEPTLAEMEEGWVLYQAKEQSDKAQADIKRASLLQKLGISEEEAKLLLS